MVTMRGMTPSLNASPTKSGAWTTPWCGPATPRSPSSRCAANWTDVRGMALSWIRENSNFDNLQCNLLGSRCHLHLSCHQPRSSSPSPTSQHQQISQEPGHGSGWSTRDPLPSPWPKKYVEIGQTLGYFMIRSFLLWEPQKSKMAVRGPQNCQRG